MGSTTLNIMTLKGMALNTMALSILTHKTAQHKHRDRTRAHTLCCFGSFFSSLEHAKNLLIMGPTTPKTHH
jgi:hypothetical protein